MKCGDLREPEYRWFESTRFANFLMNVHWFCVACVYQIGSLFCSTNVNVNVIWVKDFQLL